MVTYFVATFDTCFLKPYTTGKCYTTFSCNFFGVSTFFFHIMTLTISINRVFRVIWAKHGNKIFVCYDKLPISAFATHNYCY